MNKPSQGWNPSISLSLLLTASRKGQKANVNNGVSASIFVTNIECPCSSLYFYQCPYSLLKHSLGEKPVRGKQHNVSKHCNYFEFIMRILRISSDVESSSKVAFVCPWWTPPQFWIAPWGRWHKKGTSPKEKSREFMAHMFS